MSTEADQSVLPISWMYRRFLYWIVYPNLWVACGITSLVWFVQQSLGLPQDWRPLALIFSIALIPYILDRVVDTVIQPIPNPDRQDMFQQASVWVWLGLALAVTGVLLYRAPLAVKWVSGGGIVPFLYGLPVFPLWRRGEIGWYRLKDIPGAKAWIVCGTITYGVVAVPMAYGGIGLSSEALMTGLFLLLFVGTNSHVFDIRDLDSDRSVGVKTMPVLVGVSGTRLILTLLNGTMVAILASAWIQSLAAPDLQVVLPATGISLAYLWILTPETKRENYDVWIDGSLFLPALLSGLI